MSEELCAWCGQQASGYASANGDRFCHEGPSPTCYEHASLMTLSPALALSLKSWTDYVRERRVDLLSGWSLRDR